jgi:molecular chaperone HtpG
MTENTRDTFQVDLRGLVDLLSHHLYSSPKVYVRELLQNGIDAVTQRGAKDDRPAIRLIGSDRSADGRMHCFDSGIGLDADDVRTFLATIGRSSKRDELGFARTDMLGQFGIGLLSAFLVTDEIEVLSRKGDGPIVRWRGRGDGSYVIDEYAADGAALRDADRSEFILSSEPTESVRVPKGRQAPQGTDTSDPRHDWLAEGPGTCVSLTPRRGAEDWLTVERVSALAQQFGRFLPHRVESVAALRDVDRLRRSTPQGTDTDSDALRRSTPQGTDTDSDALRRSAPQGTEPETLQIAPLTPPWLIEDPVRRRDAVQQLGHTELGVPPFASVPVHVPAAGLSGVALILGNPTHTGRRPGSRVYLKGMLLGDEMTGLLPEWAFFVRLVVDTTTLRPTASREALYDDDLLADTRAALGEQLRRWLGRLAASEPARMNDFLRIHHVAAKAMALADDEMLTMLLPLLPFQTNVGDSTLPELLERTDTIYVTRTNDDFHQIAQVAAGQGMAVVNGGYVYEYDLLLKAPIALPGTNVLTVSPDDLDAHIRTVDADRSSAVAWPLEQMRDALDRLDVDLELRGFQPSSLPALYLDSATAQERRERRTVAETADDTWAAILGAFDDGGSSRARLLLNDDNQTVQRLLAVRDPGLAAMGIESLYTRALLMGHHRLRPADLAAMDRSFLGLLDRAIGPFDGLRDRRG